MEKLSISAIDRMNISRVDISDDPIDVLWFMASNMKNNDQQKKFLHLHTFFEIHYIMEGCVEYELKTDTYTVNKNQFFVVPPNTKHRQSAQTDSFIKLTLAFEVNDNGNKNFKSLFRKDEYLYDMSKEIRDSLKYICRQSVKKGSFYVELIKKRLNELVYLFINDTDCQYESKNEKYDDRVLSSVRFIKDNPNVFFNRLDIANECGLSPKQLDRLFLKYENKSVLEYIHNQKIRDMKESLKYSDKTQKEISEELGFSSVNYFNSFFVGKTGLTPKQYREKNNVADKSGDSKKSIPEK